MYKNVANFHRLLRTSTVQSTERVKIFPQKFFALEVGLGREELQGISYLKKRGEPLNWASQGIFIAKRLKSIYVLGEGAAGVSLE